MPSIFSFGRYLPERVLDNQELARTLGCDPGTLLNWEKGRVAPDVGFWPAILAFLGYDPRPEPTGFGGADQGGT